MGKILIAAGIALVIVGLILQFAPGLLSWFGRLPGDIRIEGARGRFYFPVVSMIIISIVLSVLLSWLRR
jgi:Protein of unknown function (DUF2905)